MKKIKLNQGKYALVDDEDFEYLNRFSWNVGDKSGVACNFPVNGQVVRLPMWRFIISPKIQRKITFLNYDCLDHRKTNLYLATPLEFNAHTRKRTKNDRRGQPTSQYKGVYHIPVNPKKKVRKHWMCTIQKDGIAHSRCFYTEREAGLYYNYMARQLFGDKAYQNKIPL